MKKAMLLAVALTLGWVAQANAQAASGTVTTTLTIEGGCTMGTDALTFTNTVSNSVTSNWTDSGNLTFACSRSVTYAVRANRVAGAGGSVQLVNTAGSASVAYAINVNSVSIPSATAVEVMTGTGDGIGTFIDIPVDIAVSQDAINGATPGTYTNVVNVEVFI
jgi:hypothetical protein